MTTLYNNGRVAKVDPYAAKYKKRPPTLEALERTEWSIA